MTKANKVTRNERNRLMIGGLQKNYKPTDTVLVAGVPTPQPAVCGVLQASNDATDRAAAAETAYHQAVAEQEAAVARAEATYTALKDYFLVVNKSTPQVLGDYGLSPVVRKPPTAEVKAAAVAKAKATRKAHQPAPVPPKA
ncbi:MAG TPA: hypothetical protein VIF09_27345 [Polyangiaceae bacterium]|jgi:hypothetical protein